MKSGDKVWFYHPIEKNAVCGECLDFYKGFQGWVCVTKYKDFPPMCLYSDEVFPTREALCEHYRKIFE